MTQPAVQLTFPCPSCGHHLNLQGFAATGPCPTCSIPITVNVRVTVGATPSGAESPVQRITPVGETDEPQLKYDERRFRPVLRMPGETP